MEVLGPALSDKIIEQVYNSTDICVVFDTQLNYVAINQAACRQLNKEEKNLIGRSIVELYPQIIASKNHRSLMKASVGTTVYADIDGANGERFATFYKPIVMDDRVEYIFVRAVKS